MSTVNINKRVVAAIAAAVLALLGIGSLVIYAHDANDRAFEGTQLVSVIRVVNEVPAGTKATVAHRILRRDASHAP